MQPGTHFDRPVAITLEGQLHWVSSLQKARELLRHPVWPRRGPWHGDAVDSAREVAEGVSSLEEARLSFVDAARESDILLRA